MPSSPDYFDQNVGKAIDNREGLRLLLTHLEFVGDPTNNVTPDYIGQYCRDTTPGSIYVATTAISSGWRVIHA